MKKLRPVPLYAVVSFALFAAAGICHIIFYKSAAFADAFNVSVGRAVRIALAKISGIFPFSVMEFMLFASPVLLFGLCMIVANSVSRGGRHAIRCVSCVLATAALVYTLFAVDFAPGYRGTSMASKMSLSERDVSVEELYKTALLIGEEVNEAAKDISFPADGSTKMPFGFREMSDILCRSYDTVCGEYDFIDRYDTYAKPLVISEYMTYTHLSGIYGFFTGDANINTNYPDYVTVYTAAHEMAHQRGFSREDEANFAAFLVCRASDNAYVRYCGALNMYEYLAGALYKASPEMYFNAYSTLCAAARGEMRSYSSFFDKYRENKAADISDSLNNSYLESQGTAGVVSYDMVVNLAVSYYMD